MKCFCGVGLLHYIKLVLVIMSRRSQRACLDLCVKRDLLLRAFCCRIGLLIGLLIGGRARLLLFDISVSGGQRNFAWCLAVFWAGTPYIHFRGLLPPYRNFAKFTLRTSLAYSYW